jgi:hypothetical protein
MDLDPDFNPAAGPSPAPRPPKLGRLMPTPEHHARSKDPGLMFCAAESGARSPVVRRGLDADARRAAR